MIPIEAFVVAVGIAAWWEHNLIVYVLIELDIEHWMETLKVRLHMKIHLNLVVGSLDLGQTEDHELIDVLNA